MENQNRIRDLWLQPISNGCQIDSLIPNAWVNRIVGTVIPYQRKTQKIYELRNIPLEFSRHQHFSIGNQQILLYQEIQI